MEWSVDINLFNLLFMGNSRPCCVSVLSIPALMPFTQSESQGGRGISHDARQMCGACNFEIQ